MSGLKRTFNENSTGSHIGDRMLARADAGKSRYNPDQMFLLVASALMRSRFMSDDDQAVMKELAAFGEAYNDTPKAVRMLNTLARLAEVEVRFRDEATMKRPTVPQHPTIN
ncbi:hypothetical protein [Micavibrio aeruginosavorus]|uniref:Uncharacterized protein n=1 Tax=Micavibrio aeruginosavorus (strain ARL-13) TaxID=856793 RepID=G2KS86_MICAA|nr:hypothetical protein [Micavibrio aeruginosavorus]AEP08769.1 hypothetical protein MICA_426 [Micavibrio aeruginosavorus ARL-13]